MPEPPERAIVIRAATAADVPHLGRLGALLVETHHAFDPQRFFASTAGTPAGYGGFLRSQLQEADAIVLVADDNGSVAGYAYATVEGTDFLALRGPAGVLHDILVDPAYRGRGVGRMLLNAALSSLREKGAPRVVLFTAERNAAAQRLFAATGFRRTMVEMTHELESQADSPSAQPSAPDAVPDTAPLSERTHSTSGPGFDVDVFVSYAQPDNIPVSEGRQGWVSTFARALAARLSQLLKRNAVVYVGSALAGGDAVNEERLKRLRNAATFVAIVSDRYVRSDWSRWELTTFFDGIEDANGRARGRVFKVVRRPVSTEQLPPELQHLLGYEFFTSDPETAGFREFDPVFGPEAERNFWLRLDDLAHDLIEPLTRLNGI